MAHYNAFVGVAAFAFAILGAILWWHERYVRWLATIALCGILFALGGNSVFHGMFYALAPLVEKARVPAAATVLFAVGVAVLAAFGLDAIRARGNTEVELRFSWVLAGVGAVLAFGSLAFYAARVPMAISGDRLVITSLCAFLAAGLFAARFSGRGVGVAAIALVLFELGNVTDYNLATADRATHPYLYKLAEHSDLAAFVRRIADCVRWHCDPLQHRRLVWNRGAQCLRRQCTREPLAARSVFGACAGHSGGPVLPGSDAAKGGFAGSISRPERSEGF